MEDDGYDYDEGLSEYDKERNARIKIRQDLLNKESILLDKLTKFEKIVDKEIIPPYEKVKSFLSELIGFEIEAEKYDIAKFPFGFNYFINLFRKADYYGDLKTEVEKYRQLRQLKTEKEEYDWARTIYQHITELIDDDRYIKWHPLLSKLPEQFEINSTSLFKEKLFSFNFSFGKYGFNIQILQGFHVMIESYVRGTLFELKADKRVKTEKEVAEFILSTIIKQYQQLRKIVKQKK